jgi:hypothetical protein
MCFTLYRPSPKTGGKGAKDAKGAKGAKGAKVRMFRRRRGGYSSGW